MELIFLYANGDMSRMKEVFDVKAHLFMFTVEYLLDKQRVEFNRNKIR